MTKKVATFVKGSLGGLMVISMALPGLTSASVQTTGNGAPSGAHYNLNIIGVPQNKTADMTGNNGSRIFVPLYGKTKIMLSQSTDGTFQVLDANGTDGSASFQLPAPGTYSVWARAVGKPGGSSTMQTCAIDPVSGDTICSTNMLVTVRGTGKSSFTNVTQQLTTITIDPTVAAALSLTCTSSTVNIFDPCLQDYFWSYDNNGLKVLQLRFYQN